MKRNEWASFQENIQIHEQEQPPSEHNPKQICTINKQRGTEFAKYKARCFVQGHEDKEKDFIIHISKTVRHKYIRILIPIAATYQSKVCNQDVNQPYGQVHDLKINVYFISDSNFTFPPKPVIQLQKHSYGLSESDDSWFRTYTSFLRKKLQLHCSPTIRIKPKHVFRIMFARVMINNIGTDVFWNNINTQMKQTYVR